MGRVFRWAGTLSLAAGLGGFGVFAYPRLHHSGNLSLYREYLRNDARNELIDGAVRVTALGTTMMLVDDGQTQILLDPYLTSVSFTDAALDRAVSTNASEVDAALDRAGAARVKAILVSHSHFDHALDLAYVAKRTGALVVGSASALNIARGSGIAEEKLRLVKPDEVFEVGDFVVRPLASRHSPHVFGGEGATIDAPLHQPASLRAYKEGGTFDYLVSRNGHTLLFKGSANWVPGALDAIRADVLFLGVGGLGNEDDVFTEEYFDATIDAVHPHIVVPTHWNDFFSPVAPPLPLERTALGHTPLAFDRLIARAKRAGARAVMLDAFSDLVLIDSGHE
jgi:L-ascorbate metabolism protein UlaG (beta-lactamase superfamily)